MVLICTATFSVAVLADSKEPFKTGDVDKNKSVNVKDATLVQKYVAGVVALDEEALLLADTDANGTVNVKDATLIQKFAAGLVAEFPQNNDKPTNPSTQAPSSAPMVTDEGTSATPTEEPSVVPTKPSVDSDGYFDVVIRP